MSDSRLHLHPPTNITATNESLEYEDVDLDLDSWLEEGGSGEGCIIADGVGTLIADHPNKRLLKQPWSEEKSATDGDGTWSPLPSAVAPVNGAFATTGVQYQTSYSLFGYARSSMRHAWSAGVGGVASTSANHSLSLPPVVIAPALKAMADDIGEEEDDDDDEDDLVVSDDESSPPGMVPVTSESDQSSEASSDSDETMSDASSAGCDGDGDVPTLDLHGDGNNLHVPNPILSRGVTFNEQVRVLPIPPLEDYTPDQRYRMYANRFELRENKVRNKREYEFDKYDWRNATEEHSMAFCPVSGELLHPAHL